MSGVPVCDLCGVRWNGSTHPQSNLATYVVTWERTQPFAEGVDVKRMHMKLCERCAEVLITQQVMVAPGEARGDAN